MQQIGKVTPVENYKRQEFPLSPRTRIETKFLVLFDMVDVTMANQHLIWQPAETEIRIKTK